jgi:hypothetical protein
MRLALHADAESMAVDEGSEGLLPVFDYYRALEPMTTSSESVFGNRVPLGRESEFERSRAQRRIATVAATFPVLSCPPFAKGDCKIPRKRSVYQFDSRTISCFVYLLLRTSTTSMKKIQGNTA